MTPLQRLSLALKLVVAHALYYTGVLHLWQSIAMRRKAVVLMYHRVLTEPERARAASHPALSVDRETFARQMALLKRRFTVLSPQEFADCLERRVPFPDRACLITFDDGWRDNYTNALPVLEEHGLPALIFLPVNYIGRRRVFWQEALTHLLARVVAEVRRDPAMRARFLPALSPAGLEPIVDLDGGDPRPAIHAAVGAQKALTRPAVETLVSDLAAALGANPDDFAVTDGFMDWAEVEAMSRRRIAFGGHGAEHLLLTHVSPGEVDAEIRTSKRVIDERVRGAVPAFSYPNGYVTPEIAAKVKASGYRLGFTTRRGLVGCDEDPHMVRRLNIHEAATATTPMFLARVLGLW